MINSLSPFDARPFAQCHRVLGGLVLRVSWKGTEELFVFRDYLL